MPVPEAVRMKIAIDRIDPDPNQPRRHFGGLEEPAESIKANGLIEPITARPAPGPAAMYTSSTPEWYTPKTIIDAVLALFGEIDLDPCSNADGADAKVPAKAHFTEADDGLSLAWSGKVYMNPPYGRIVAKWVEKALKEVGEGRIEEIVILVAGRLDTIWYQSLSPKYLRCEIKGRLHFSDSKNSAPFPSVAFYIGPRPARFAEVFGKFGEIAVPWSMVRPDVAEAV